MGSKEEEDGEKGLIDCSNSSSPSSSPPTLRNNNLRFGNNNNKREGMVEVQRGMCCTKKEKMGLGPGLGQRSMSLDHRRMRRKTRRSLLWDLEFEEVKGFMDLGFRFEKEQVNPELMNVLPGLQRFGSSTSTNSTATTTTTGTDLDELRESSGGLFDDDDEEEEEDDGVELGLRPYLSEAWLIKRPDSPLLNLRIPNSDSSTPADMKKHLRCWARTVASEILLG